MSAQQKEISKVRGQALIALRCQANSPSEVNEARCVKLWLALEALLNKHIAFDLRDIAGTHHAILNA